MVHTLQKTDFIKVLSNRNLYKITPALQQTLSHKSIGIIGLSVGSFIAFGAALKNLTIAATHLGYTANYSLFPYIEARLIAASSFTKSSIPEPNLLYDYRFKRATNREVSTQKISANDKKNIIELNKLKMP